MTIRVKYVAAWAAVGLALAPNLACGGDDQGAASSPDHRGTKRAQSPAPWVTLTHEPSGFRIEVPTGFGLKVHKGVYILKKGKQSLSFSRSVTSVSPAEYGDALLKQIGGTVVSRRAGNDEFTAEADRGSHRETFVVDRAGGGIAVVTGRTPRSSPLSLQDLRRIGGSAKGGFALRAPATQASMPLKQYRAPDGGATALVPSDPGWNIQSGKGTLQGSSKRGAFLMGYSVDVLLPEHAPPNSPSSLLVSPYLDPPSAVAQLFPKVSSSVSDIKVHRTIKAGVLPTFTASGMYQFDYKVDGKPWTGAATVATDSPDKYSNFAWHLYYSGIGVPAGSDPSIGTGLLGVWRSWNPSGAIAQRSQQAKELLDQTNDVWRETSEFRANTADRQSRDVGCLLQGYSEIEDNSRKYDLPPLACGQQYGPGGG